MADPNSPRSIHRERSRACAYCNKSKTKCLWSGEPGVDSCQRCSRLKRACEMPEQVARRRRGASSRVIQLEKKLDGIMSLLNASQPLQPRRTPPTISSSPHSNAVASPDPLPPQPILWNNPKSIDAGSVEEFFDVGPSLRVPIEEANRYLDLYRSQYSPKFPFVPIANCLSAIELYKRQPFLFQVIMQIVAPQSPSVQREVDRWVREYIARSVIVDQERRLDLIQGLLLFVAWGDFHFYIDPRGTNLFQLAAGLVIEAGLNRPVKTPSHVPNGFLDAARSEIGSQKRSSHTLEEMRVFLGVFYVNCLGASLFLYLPMFDYTDYMTSCRIVIEREAEFESDQLLSALVRLQQVLCKMHSKLPKAPFDGSEPVGFSGMYLMAMTTFRTELEDLVSKFPSEIRKNYLLDVCYRGMLTKVYEPAIYTTPSVLAGSGESAWRSEALWCCLEASKNCLVAYCDIPVDELPYLPCMAFSFFSYTVVTTTRLLFISDSDWDQAVARRTMDFVAVTRRLSDRFDEADQVAARAEIRCKKNKCVEDGRSVMGLSRDKLRWINSWYLSKQGVAEQEPQAAEAELGPVEGGDPRGSFPLVELDNEWWGAMLLGDYEFGG